MRGEIENRARATQVRDFTGLRWGKITPTDVDGFIEFRDKLFVFIEIKLVDWSLPDGQKRALGNACDAIANKTAGRTAVVLVVEHDTPIGTDIDVASCVVREFRMQEKWREPLHSPLTCREAVDILLKQAGILL